MADMVMSHLPRRSAHRSRYQKLFEQVSDGQVWKISKAEYEPTSVHKFRCALQGWFRHRRLVAETRVDEDGNMFVQVRKMNAEIEVEA